MQNKMLHNELKVTNKYRCPKLVELIEINNCKNNEW